MIRLFIFTVIVSVIPLFFLLMFIFGRRGRRKKGPGEE